MSQPKFEITQGDLGPSLALRLIDPDGSTPDLTGASVKFNMRIWDPETPDVLGTVKINHKDVVILSATPPVDPAAFNVRYDWSGLDTDTAGSYLAEFEVTKTAVPISYPNGRNTRKIHVVIGPQIA